MENQPTPQKRTEKNEPIDDPFVDINQMQADIDFRKKQRESVQRIFQTNEGEPAQSIHEFNKGAIDEARSQHQFTSGQIATATILAGVAGVAVVGGGALLHGETTKGPEFSDKIHEYVVQPGDGLENAAMDVAGARTVDIRDVEHHISVDPANIDILKDGLQPGEQLEVPNSVEK